ncbi:hypothetical protein IHV12_20055 [Fictibacillus sp. 7GRE50]|uniref:hypothetical protein n=1 Tax=Fictibacillus sp. 7GRE50 TaxID=2745878 RepID=UPI0018CF8870|nr:hypothetical protein [Fictibacillus sp. 7GRE50]MBH0167222.1 hypothetical protein [Fictibacillus sp. 7GRE50]
MRNFLTLITSICILLSLSSCSNEKSNTPESKEQSTTKLSDEQIQSILEDEVKEIESLNQSEFLSSSEVFRTNIDSFIEPEGKVTFDVTIDKPKEYMEQVIITAVLNKQANESLKAPFLNFSNLISVYKSGETEFSKNFTIGPNIKETKGISMGKTFILNEGYDLEDVLAASPELLIKVSWLTEKKEKKKEYLRITRDQINIRN